VTSDGQQDRDERSGPDEPPEPGRRPGGAPRPNIPLVLAFYALLAGAAVVWDALRSGPSRLLPQPEAAHPAVSVALALAFAAAAVGSSRLLERRFAWARRLTAELARVLGPLAPREIAVFSLASGVAEELFFRGALQPDAGIWLTSLIFGLCHGYLDRRFVSWMVMATAVGFGLGLLAHHTGSLLAPTIAHFTINYVEFHALDRVARGPAPGDGR